MQIQQPEFTEPSKRVKTLRFARISYEAYINRLVEIYGHLEKSGNAFPQKLAEHYLKNPDEYEFITDYLRLCRDEDQLPDFHKEASRLLKGSKLLEKHLPLSDQDIKDIRELEAKVEPGKIDLSSAR